MTEAATGQLAEELAALLRHHLLRPRRPSRTPTSTARWMTLGGRGQAQDEPGLVAILLVGEVAVVGDRQSPGDR